MLSTLGSVYGFSSHRNSLPAVDETSLTVYCDIQMFSAEGMQLWKHVYPPNPQLEQKQRGDSAGV